MLTCSALRAHGETTLPSFFVVTWRHVTRSGQWDVTRGDRVQRSTCEIYCSDQADQATEGGALASLGP